jgi:hypothetical protein
MNAYDKLLENLKSARSFDDGERNFGAQTYMTLLSHDFTTFEEVMGHETETHLQKTLEKCVSHLIHIIYKYDEEIDFIQSENSDHYQRGQDRISELWEENKALKERLEKGTHVTVTMIDKIGE